MRVRLLALLSALALWVIAAVPASATSEGHSYLALGDSVSFGTNPLLDIHDASNFVGFPDIVAQRLNIADVNVACPGEATGGFISLTGTDNVCRPYRFGGFFPNCCPLHVSYTGTQLAFATSYLTSHPRTRLVTIMLGANDIFRFQKDCAMKPPGPTCALGLSGVLAVMGANLNTIFTALRATGYTGLIVAVTYYSLDYTNNNAESGAIALNAPMIAAAQAHGAVIADGLAAWRGVASGETSCAAGLLIALPTGGCDVHPTPKGRDLLAGAVIDAIAGTCPAASPTGCLDRSQP
jgi:lysophospholipase L1-like esterase